MKVVWSNGTRRGYNGHQMHVRVCGCSTCGHGKWGGAVCQVGWCGVVAEECAALRGGVGGVGEKRSSINESSDES